MADVPNQPPQNPNQQPINIPQIQQKLKGEDLVDIEDLKSTLSSISKVMSEQMAKVSHESAAKFKASFQEIRLEEEKGRKANQIGIKTMRTAEEQYIRYTSTAERNKHSTLIKQRTDLINTIKKERNEEITGITESTASAEEKEAKIKDAMQRTEEKIANIKKAKSKEIKSAADAAWDSEHGNITKAKNAMARFFSTPIGIAKNLLDTKSWWEAMIVLLITASKRLSDIATTQGAVRTAGLVGTHHLIAPTGTNVNLAAGLSTNGVTGDVDKLESAFGELKEKLSLTDSDVDGFIQTLAKSPKALKETLDDNGKGITDFVYTMGGFGISIQDSIQIVADAGNTWGATTKNLTDVMKKAYTVTKLTGMNTTDAMNTMNGMVQSLRGLTFNAAAAKDMITALSIGFNLQALKGNKFSADEIKSFESSFAQFVGSFSPSKISGLMALGTGHLPTTMKQLSEASDHPMRLVIGALRSTLDRIPKTSLNRGFAIQKFAEEGLLPSQLINNPKLIAAFNDMYELLKMTPDILEKKAQALGKDKKTGKTPDEEFKDVQKAGMQTLADKQGPLQTMAKSMEAMVQSISVIFIPMAQGIIRIIPKLNHFIEHPFSGGGPDMKTNAPMTEAELPGVLGRGQFRAKQNLLKHLRSSGVGVGITAPNYIDSLAHGEKTPPGSGW